MTNLIFLDLETTGLDPSTSSIWEMAFVLAEHENGELTMRKSRRRQFFPDRFDSEWLDTPFADDFKSRFEVDSALPFAGNSINELIVECQADAVRFSDFDPKVDYWYLVGMCPWFDQEHIKSAAPGRGLPWHYHLVDVENLIAGKLNVTAPWKSNDLSRAVGVNPDDYHRHTALGDVQWCMALYAAVYGLDVNQEGDVM